MSSPSYHPPPHLHRVNLHSHGKRPFEECGGYDSDPDTSMPIHPTTSGTSSSNNDPFSTGPSLHNPEARNKRARSTSSTSTDDSTTNPSSSGYNTAQSSSQSDIFSDGPSASPMNPIDCPIHPVVSPSPFVTTQDVHMSDLPLPVPPTQPQRTHIPTPSTPEDTLRTSLQRFAEFDRHIAALRTSLAATRSPALPTMGPSVDGGSALSIDHWHSNPQNFPSNAGSNLPPTSTDPASSTVAVAPSQTLDSLSAFACSDDSANITAPTSTVSGSNPSASFPPTYSNTPRHQNHSSYHTSADVSSSLVTHERAGDVASSQSTLAFMRPSSNENTTRVGPRSSISVDPSAPPSGSHMRHVRRSLSPLVLPLDSSSSSPPSVVADDILSRYRLLYCDGELASGRSHRWTTSSPVSSQDRGVSSRQEDHLGEQLRSSQNRFGDRVRVIREHFVERESVPSIFDVFNIAESSQERNRPVSVREPAAPRYTSIAESVPPRVHGTPNGRSRDPAPITVNTSQGPSQDIHTRFQSSWTSIPSSNSLMSESASERRHALALERFRARLRRSSFDADDELDSRWSGSSRGERERESGDLGVTSPVPPSPSVESAPGTGTSSHFPLLGSATRAPFSMTNRTEPATSMPLQRSFSELFAETQRVVREEGADAWLLDWDSSRVAERERRQERERERERQLDRERQRERVWEWERERERQRERSGQDVRGRSLASGSSLASTNSVRDETSDPPVPAPLAASRSSLGQLGAGPNTTTTNNHQQYSYGNLNLSSFQSGLFRDSLRRNVEVDQASFSTGGPVIPSTPMDSRATSRLGLDDSESEMDFDDFVRTRPPSPEWSRPHPYAGRTPPPDYSPPSRNLNLPPGFSALRRNRVTNANYDALPYLQQPNRNSTMLTRPIPAAPSAARPPSFENNSQPTPSDRTQRDRFLPARILESFYRSHEDGRRNGSTGAGQPHQPNQNYAVGSSSGPISRNERNDALGGRRNTSGNGIGNRPGHEGVGENRRNSLGLGGSIRSRLARLANPQSALNAADVSSASRQRSPPRPMGARPQVGEQRRRAPLVFGNTVVFDSESRTEARSVSGPLHWTMNGGAAEPSSVVTRDVPWRASSGSRSVLAPPPSASSSGRPEVAELVGRAEEQRSRLRTLRQRLQLDRGGEGMRALRPGMLRGAIGRRGNLGDYVPDELFDDSYEALLSLSSTLGDVRSRATPEEVIALLPTGTFKEWKREDSETRCPICLDDYEPSDVLTKLIECPHWLHKNCLEQWLRTASTCPVCREKVKASPKPAPARRRPYRDLSALQHSNQGAISGNDLSGGPPQTALQANNGRPSSFAAMVFDRLMSETRDGPTESWTSSPPAVPPPSRNVRQVYLERLRAQQQQQRAREPHQPAHTHDHHDVYVEFASPHELPYHLRVPASSQPGLSSRPTAGAGPDGPGVRPPGFVSMLRGQVSDSSMSTSSSASMVADDVGASSRRSMAAGTDGGSGSGSGSLFLDVPTVQRRENTFGFAPPSSGTFGVAGSPATGPPPPPPAPLPQQRQTISFDAHTTPAMTMSGSTESSRNWRGARASGYDALFNVETSRSSSSPFMVSGSQPRPMNVANRIPVEEDSPFEDYVFGWNLRGGGRLGANSGP